MKQLKISVKYEPVIDGIPGQAALVDHLEGDRFVLRPMPRPYKTAGKTAERRVAHETIITPTSLRLLADQLERVTIELPVEV